MASAIRKERPSDECRSIRGPSSGPHQRVAAANGCRIQERSSDSAAPAKSRHPGSDASRIPFRARPADSGLAAAPSRPAGWLEHRSENVSSGDLAWPFDRAHRDRRRANTRSDRLPRRAAAGEGESNGNQQVAVHRAKTAGPAVPSWCQSAGAPHAAHSAFGYLTRHRSRVEPDGTVLCERRLNQRNERRQVPCGFTE
jgi:hypothetical protein